MIGITFIMTDGTKDHYDPLSSEASLSEDENTYKVDLPHAVYDIPKSEVIGYEFYRLCPKCGYELKNNSCDNYSCTN